MWWSEVAHDWRIFDQEQYANLGDSSAYEKSVNIFRAYLESLIAAMSVTIPHVKCYPDDAENSLDLSTAKAGDRIYELVSKHNDAPLLWLHALFIYCTEGMVACYNYTDYDKKYGTYEKKKFEQQEIDETYLACQLCGHAIDEFDPTVDEQSYLCPACNSQLEPELRNKKVVVSKFVGTTDEPKSRQKLEVYGGLFVKVPNYARTQADCPYLIFAYETNYVNVMEKYPKLKEKFKGASNYGVNSTNGGVFDPYERQARLSTQYGADMPMNNLTVRNCWLRPAAFNILPDQTDVDLLKEEFPHGARVVIVNDTFAEACDEDLDDHWTITHNPLSDYIHYDPIGKLLTNVQDMISDILSLTVQTIEHGIGQTFVDPGVVDLDAYQQTEATPGMLFGAIPKSGKSMQDAFYEIKTATLSSEVLPFEQKVEELGQQASGALPSLFGGSQPNSSKTAAQYSMSRAQAMQRLQTPWKMFSFWWKNIFGKVIPAYIKSVVEDERLVKRDDSGNFINVFIRKTELIGKLGSVELETNDQLPANWAQKKDVIMQLLQASNPVMMQAISAPENVKLVCDAIGIGEFTIPGEADRQKQYEEIGQLIVSEPIMDPMMGMEIPSVPIEPLADNHLVQAEICRHWLVSDPGRLAKLDNPSGYKNVLLHLQAHVTAFQEQQMNAAPAEQPVEETNPKPIAAQVKKNVTAVN